MKVDVQLWSLEVGCDDNKNQNNQNDQLKNFIH